MLHLNDIAKTYTVGDASIQALKDVNLAFRNSEFVAILGPSGSGKTTLLNIIGGLDHYTTGDLVINGISTKEYKDGDWDIYRNRSVGFVFQNYNLIPHQSVLANVELALTLSGVSKTERRKRAVDALEQVGLGDQLHKKPSQISGGQMQRVAIARALVNNPEILLADEPTGALDSETSVQVMEILKEISKDRLIIMVTHNSELAATYATRTIRLRDGGIISDSAPYVMEDNKKSNKGKRQKKTSMGFLTALSLSLNNLMTKKTRTILTAFAGSIGIIGIALILAVSTGVQAYIDRVQQDTLSSYPIMIEAESVDMTSLVNSLMGAREAIDEVSHALDAVYESQIISNLMDAMNSTETTSNNLYLFREFLETNEDMRNHTSAIQYTYDFDFNIFVKDKDDRIIKSDVSTLLSALYGAPGMQFTSAPGMQFTSTSGMNTLKTWEELLAGTDGELVNGTLKEQYDVIYGTWPEAYNEVVLIVDKNNEISDLVLYSLGLKTADEINELLAGAKAENGGTPTNRNRWSYEEICDMPFRLILSSDYYQKNSDGTYTDLTASDTGLAYLFNSDRAVTLKVSGIVRENPDAVSTMLSGAIGYTSALTEYIVQRTAGQRIIADQLSAPAVDVITGLPFANGDDADPSDAEKAAAIREYVATLSTSDKAAVYTSIMSIPTADYLDTLIERQMSQMSREHIESAMAAAYAEQMGVDTEVITTYIAEMTDEELLAYAREMVQKTIGEKYAQQVRAELGQKTMDELAIALDHGEFTDAQLAAIYEDYIPSAVSESTFEDNLRLLGHIDIDSPSGINIYASTFSAKDEIADIISEYNKTVGEADAIIYTDYVALLMSSITDVIGAISYVLIGFVCISLVVSSIMIGVITYISVLERTREIGILRSIGASKGDISRVFNAETLIEGFVSGMIGIGVTLLLIIPINLIVFKLTGIQALSAVLPTESAVTLVVISMALTFIAGLIPSRIASKKDPVEALRTE